MNKLIPEGFVLNDRRGPYTSHNGPFYINTIKDPWVHGTYIIERHCNAAQIAHGGMLMSFADGVCGHAVYKEAQIPGVTIKFNSEFLSAARTDEWLEGEARVTSIKDDFAFCEARLYVSNRDVLLVNTIFKLRTNKQQKRSLKKRR